LYAYAADRERERAESGNKVTNTQVSSFLVGPEGRKHKWEP